MKPLIVAGLLAILVALCSAGVYMVRRPRSKDPRGTAMARALAVRVGLSVLLFVVVLFSYWMGWIQPTGIPLK
jgi:hypothetical protein